MAKIPRAHDNAEVKAILARLLRCNADLIQGFYLAAFLVDDTLISSSNSCCHASVVIDLLQREHDHPEFHATLYEHQLGHPQ